jgi:hypothetical protein
MNGRHADMNIRGAFFFWNLRCEYPPPHPCKRIYGIVSQVWIQFAVFIHGLDWRIRFFLCWLWSGTGSAHPMSVFSSLVPSPLYGAYTRVILTLSLQPLCVVPCYTLHYVNADWLQFYKLNLPHFQNFDFHRARIVHCSDWICTGPPRFIFRDEQLFFSSPTSLYRTWDHS